MQGANRADTGGRTIVTDEPRGNDPTQAPGDLSLDDLVDSTTAKAIVAIGLWTVLRPSLKVMGEALGRYTDAGLRGIERVLKNALTKGEPSALVQPRVARAILDQAVVADTDVLVDYLGGVLASSTEMDDDQGAAVAAQIARMSSLQLRLHFVLYRAARELFSGTDVVLNDSDDVPFTSLFIPEDELLEALGVTADEKEVVLDHAVDGLVRESLIDVNWAWCNSDEWAETIPFCLIEEKGLVVRPSAAGAAFLLWGMGHGGYGHRRLFDPVIDLSMALAEADGGVPDCPGARRVSDFINPGPVRGGYLAWRHRSPQ